jgi:hypothetical protein
MMAPFLAQVRVEDRRSVLNMLQDAACNQDEFVRCPYPGAAEAMHRFRTAPFKKLY